MKKGRLRTSLKKSAEILGVLMTVISFFLAVITWEDIGVTSLGIRIALIISLCVIVLVLVGLYIRYWEKDRTAWERASSKIKVCYLDLIQEAFSSRKSEEAIYVIPVNTAFDTIVDDAKQIDPLVAPKSLHGKFIKKICEQGFTVSELDKRIEESLQAGGYTPVAEENKARGKGKKYDIGTVVTIRGTRNYYYLLALTNYDKHNKAYCSLDDVKRSIESLIKYYDQNGQGIKLVVPLMGTGFSRTSLSHEDSLRIITSLFLLNANILAGEVDVAIYNGDKDKVSIEAF